MFKLSLTAAYRPFYGGFEKIEKSMSKRTTNSNTSHVKVLLKLCLGSTRFVGAEMRCEEPVHDEVIRASAHRGRRADASNPRGLARDDFQRIFLHPTRGKTRSRADSNERPRAFTLSSL